MKKEIQNLIVIGAGPHFRERHFKVLQEMRLHGKKIRLILVIDLIDQKNLVIKFFEENQFKSENYLFLPEECRYGIPSPQLDALIKAKINLEEVDGVIISTEPKVHKCFSLWAIQNGLHLFIDKPLTAFCSYEDMDTLFQDYLEIEEALEENKVNFVLSCERRAHAGYAYLKKYIKDIIHSYEIPITFIDIHFGGGKWYMPDEYFYLENHPYKYGYGVLLHSGYHYIDLLVTLLSLNEPIVPYSFDDIFLYSIFSTPYDLSQIIDNKIYRNLFKTNRFETLFKPQYVDQMRHFGEVDFMAIGNVKKNSKIVTNFSIQLLETTASKRNWHELPENLYFMGRMRQESVIIHIGHLCSIHVKSHPISKLVENNKIEDFSIDIIHNSNLINRDALVQIKRSDLSKFSEDLLETDSMNVKARNSQLIDFLNMRDGSSSLKSHKPTIQLLDAIYGQIKRERAGNSNNSNLCPANWQSNFITSIKPQN